MIQNPIIMKKSGSTEGLITFSRKYLDSEALGRIELHLDWVIEEAPDAKVYSFLGAMDSLLPQLMMCTSYPVIYSKKADESYGKDIVTIIRSLPEGDKNKIYSYLREIFAVIGDRTDLDTLSTSEKNHIKEKWRKIFSLCGKSVYSDSQEFIVINVNGTNEAIHILTLYI